MGERPKGPMPDTWQPADPIGQLLMEDIIQRLQQHRDEDTLPRSPRGLFYDLRPNGLGRGLTYSKQPRMVAVGRSMRRADPAEIGPVQVQEMLVKMRRALIVPENWIEDTRAPRPEVPFYSDQTAESEADSIIDSIEAPYITYSPQRGQDTYIEVLVEAAGLIGRTARIAGQFGVPVYSGGGFDGLKGKRAFAQRAANRDVPTKVLRISDYDDHGLRIADSSAADSEAWATMYYGAEYEQLTFNRIALTQEQAEDAGLLDENGKAEADGLPVPVMDAILTSAIEAYQDPAVREQNELDAADEVSRVRELVLSRLNGQEE